MFGQIRKNGNFSLFTAFKRSQVCNNMYWCILTKSRRFVLQFFLVCKQHVRILKLLKKELNRKNVLRGIYKLLLDYSMYSAAPSGAPACPPVRLCEEKFKKLEF